MGQSDQRIFIIRLCDLAILRVNDNSFFSDVEPVEIGALAEVRDRVAVYAFFFRASQKLTPAPIQRMMEL